MNPPTPSSPPPSAKSEPLLITTPAKPLPSPSKTTFPTPPPSTVVGNWILHKHSFAPKRDHFMAFCSALSRRRVTDRLMWFQFPPKPPRPPVPVHYSRLAWAGGRLAELVMAPPDPEAPDTTIPTSPSSKKVEIDVATDDPDHPFQHKDPVELTSMDTPRTFAIIVKFLYCEQIDFNYLTFDEIVALSSAAHRWALTDLYNATFAYVMDQDLLAGGYGIRTFVPLVSHPETPESFRRYFCIAIGHHFDVLYPRLRATVVDGMNISTPPLWNVVIQQGMLSHVIHCISLYSPASYCSYLLDVIMRHYESQSKEEDDVLGLLSQLNWDDIDVTNVMSVNGMCKNWSPRAVRLAALASYAPQTESLEVRIPWNIPLQKLLKTEAWSFQTEHVPCGPYICYLHVRKGTGAEVSLFVHIWNHDQKPIGEGARHESVRVKCRATERNCHCDSGRQWSDSNHGFLENLKFEGKLERYPGLGWSQFLEEKRLEEWRGCHGDECGLAITTVLQFTKPRKQFEGPARRLVRAHSPTSLASPIQKKRSGTRMKLREVK